MLVLNVADNLLGDAGAHLVHELLNLGLQVTVLLLDIIKRYNN